MMVLGDILSQIVYACCHAQVSCDMTKKKMKVTHRIMEVWVVHSQDQDLVAHCKSSFVMVHGKVQALMVHNKV